MIDRGTGGVEQTLGEKPLPELNGCYITPDIVCRLKTAVVGIDKWDHHRLRCAGSWVLNGWFKVALL